MKKNINNQDVSVFKFQFTPLMLVLGSIALLLCTVSVGLSIWRLTLEGLHDIRDYLKYPFLILISLFGATLIVALFASSRYIVHKDKLTLQFGFIKNHYPISAITSLLLDTDTKKLTVFMGEEFFVLTTNPLWNNDLVQAIREANENVEFSFTLSEPQEKKENK